MSTDIPSDIKQLFDQLWSNYTKKNKLPQKVFDKVSSLESNVINDHIALRTFNMKSINMHILAQDFIDLGYKVSGKYNFEKKKLNAIHLEHENPLCPKVFVSELRTQRLSEQAQDIIQGLYSQIDFGRLHEAPLCLFGRPWNISYFDYKRLAMESEYAAWMAAHGYMANHFTISLNHLSRINSLSEMNQFVKDSGYPLNESGGEIKGSASAGLEQSSTVAELVNVDFKGRCEKVPGCFIEFAKRYADSGGKLFSGFVTQSADKTFESTDNKVAA